MLVQNVRVDSLATLVVRLLTKHRWVNRMRELGVLEFLSEGIVIPIVVVDLATLLKLTWDWTGPITATVESFAAPVRWTHLHRALLHACGSLKKTLLELIHGLEAMSGSRLVSRRTDSWLLNVGDYGSSFLLCSRPLVHLLEDCVTLSLQFLDLPVLFRKLCLLALDLIIESFFHVCEFLS